MTCKKILLLTLCLLSWNPVWGGQTSNSIPKMGFSALTFEQRVAYQRAIEEVYWRHRTWPAENKTSKPRLDKVMPDNMIRAKVEDYLKKSNALAEIWQRPITSKQLQGELNRIIKNTKQPAVLRDLFAALDNNPQVIAECLVRPILVDRLMRNWYANDDRFHGSLKQQIESELRQATAPNLRTLSGRYSEMEIVKSTGKTSPQKMGYVNVNETEWNQKVEDLQAMFGAPRPGRFQKKSLPVGRLSGLQQDADRFYLITVLEKDSGRMKTATIDWPKRAFDAWWAQEKNRTTTNIVEDLHLYNLEPLPSTSSCTDDTWTAIQEAFPTRRSNHTAVWTGSEMIIWGGASSTGSLSSGARYNPSTDSWNVTSTTNVPDARLNHAAIWTGTEMIVWGGEIGLFSPLSSGGRYDPSTDTWTATSSSNVPDARSNHTAVWSGSKMIVWGGRSGFSYLSSGGVYDPSNDSWTATNTVNVPEARGYHTAVWNGSEMIVWGGDSTSGLASTGGRYDLSNDSWTATTTTDAPDARYFHTAVWTGTEMIVWGGANYNTPISYSSGGRYDPSNDSWTGTSSTNAPDARYIHTAVWTGTEMIVWGGSANSFLNSGGRYDPSNDSWIATNTNTVPDPRSLHTAVWTGTELIIWGGDVGAINLDTGGRYDPSTDNWTLTSTIGAPDGRRFHTAVWTGTEMIIWGGYDGTEKSTGGRYNPSTDTWTSTTLTNVPSARHIHTAVWTGTEMIIWGGFDAGPQAYFSTGGRYDPSTDTWTATNTTNAPNARFFHTAVWTGTEMIVWGGYMHTGPVYFSSGGRYDPSTDSWTATTSSGAPFARAFHSAVWSGTEMIIWGGQDSTFTDFSSGSRYNPSADNWTDTSTTGAPNARNAHAAVWTGTEMIIWGGGTSCCKLATGSRYNPSTDSWNPTSMISAPHARSTREAVWTGTEMIIWGGFGDNSQLDTGGRYCASGSTAATPDVSIADASISEGNAGTTTLDFDVTLSEQSSEDVTVYYSTADDTAADADNDYEAATNSIMILAGETEGTISITINGDTKFELNETFFVNLTSATNATVDDDQATGTINNDDTPPVITINDKSIQEPASGTGSVNANFTVTVTPVSGADVEVDYATANGTASAGQDYNEITTTTLTIPAGQTQGTITVEVLGDGKAEASETYFVNLSLPSGATISDAQGKGTITNRKPGLTINDVSQSEGNSGTTNASFTVTPSFIYDAAITVDYTTQDGAATQPLDYTLTVGTLNIPASTASGVIDVSIVGETLAEPNETYTVKLSSAVNATLSDSTGAGTIVNDDGALPTLSVNDASVTEGDSGTLNATFTITQSAVSGSNTTVKFATQDATAKQPGDYTKKSVTVTIPQGSTEVQVSVTINGDTLYEADETFKVNLTNVVGATIADGQGIGTIQNDDTAPTLSINDISVNEIQVNQSVTFTVSLSQVSGVATTVLYSTANGSAVEPGDYTKKTNISLSIPAGTLSKTFNITVKGDAVAEPQENFFVNLSSPENATILDGQGECTINDND